MKVNTTPMAGVSFDFKEKSKAEINNFGLTETAINPDRYVKHILKLGSQSSNGIFHYIPTRHKEAKALKQAVMGGLLLTVVNEDGVLIPDTYAITDKGRLSS